MGNAPFLRKVPHMSKIEQIIQRKDGSEIKIVAQSYFDFNQNYSADVFVLRRKTPDDPWKVLNDRPHPDWRSMSVDEYLKHGRSEMLQAVSHAEIIKVTNTLKTHCFQCEVN